MNKEIATTKKPHGRGKINGNSGKKYSKEYQPSAERKKAGWLKWKRGQDLVKAILTTTFNGVKGSELRKMCSEYYNVPENKITVEMMLLFRQTEKAIQKADTPAFNAIMDRAHGKPSQNINFKDESDPVVIILPNGREVEI